jgi:hypothetical protein
MADVGVDEEEMKNEEMMARLEELTLSLAPVVPSLASARGLAVSVAASLPPNRTSLTGALL